MQLFSAEITILSKEKLKMFFVYENTNKWPSKVAHKWPKNKISSTAPNWPYGQKFNFHIRNWGNWAEAPSVISTL